MATFLFIGANLFVINKKLFYESKNPKIAAFTTNITPVPMADSCSTNCLAIIREATASLQLATTPTTTSPLRPVVQQIQPTTPQVRELFVPLGTGSGSSDTWADVPGAQATIDSAQYAAIKEVKFEAAVDVPGHNEAVWVRLYNDTDKYIIGGSELYYPDGNGAALQSTGTISLGAGNKVYKVQIKTQLKFPANVTTARIHILTN